jgi:cytidylate kinase
LGIIVAIDGPAGAGKSTVTRLVAKKLGFLYLDTGAMYRAVAWTIKAHRVKLDNEEEIVRLTKRMQLDLVGDEVFLHGEEITSLIRTSEMGKLASAVSKIEGVRSAMVTLQRKLALSVEPGAVVEGRDMGTVVFPKTPFKFYLDASLEERARRRMAELHAAGESSMTLEKMIEDIRERDSQDKNRKNSPLRIAEGATVIDTTYLSIEQVVERIVGNVKSRI